jgi:hypothetical protein
MHVFDQGDVVSVLWIQRLGAYVRSLMANGHHGPLSVADLRALREFSRRQQTRSRQGCRENAP